MIETRAVVQQTHRRTLGALWILYGVYRLGFAIWLIAFSGKATVIFGTLLSRVGDPFTLMNIFHFFYAVSIVYSLICGVFGILAGLALRLGSRSRRILGIIAAVLSLSGIPLGLTLGTYTLVVLFATVPYASTSSEARVN